MRVHGTVTQWRDDKGFGFIEPANRNPALFFHEKFLLHQARRPQVGDTVSFEIATNSEGKRRAERVLFPGERDPKRRDQIFDIVYISLACLFFLCIGLFVYQKKLSPVLVFVYVFISLMTFLLYWHDKNKAKNDQWRTPEKTLHFFSLIGGWPGALVAQRLLHHKSRKKSFQMIFAATTLFNLAFVAFYMTYLNNFDLSNTLSNNYKNIRNQLSYTPDQQTSRKKKGPVYSWINKNGKKVYSTVGFPADEPYAEGKIEWQ